MSIKEKMATLYCYIAKVISVIIFVACGHYATVYFDTDYQSGSSANLDDCAKSRDVYRCVLVAAEDERN